MELSRAERRRFERELDKLKPNEGVGEGYRLTAGFIKNKYLVKEPKRPIDVDKLLHDCEESIRRNKL